LIGEFHISILPELSVWVETDLSVVI